MAEDRIPLIERTDKVKNDDYDEKADLIDFEDMDETPKTSTGRETLRPKKFKGGESKWDPVETPKFKKNIAYAMEEVEKNFPNLNRSKLDEFVVNINEDGEVTIRSSTRINAVTHNLFDDDGELSLGVPGTIRAILGDQISRKEGLKEQLMNEKENIYIKERYKRNGRIK